MTKLLLVEDDNNLREIYGARLGAEGYEIVSAKDGEEALALAVKERPDLIISDVMMPKISGFDMLDILRSTTETKNVRVIMMTALSQKEDQERGARLGADRYLVKSQVTLEDVVKAVADVLSEPPKADIASAEPTQPAATPAAPAPEPAVVAAPAPEPVTPAPTPEPVVEPPTTAVAPHDSAPVGTTPPASSAATQGVAYDSNQAPINIDMPAEPVPAEAAPTDTTGSTIDSGPKRVKKVIEPINDVNQKPDLNALLAQEEATTTATPTIDTSAETAANEQAEVEQQIDSFVNGADQANANQEQPQA
jgi:CheY-like chemotaxis protein